jgi:hypothetical protein
MQSIRKKINNSIRTSNRIVENKTGYSLNKVLLGLTTLIVVFIALWWMYKWWRKGIDPKEVPQMKRPFLNMWAVRKDGSEYLVNIVFITHPFTRDECIEQYNDAKQQNVHFLGMSSYSEFPGPVSNPHDVLHDPKIDAWTKYNYFDLRSPLNSLYSDTCNICVLFIYKFSVFYNVWFPGGSLSHRVGRCVLNSTHPCGIPLEALTYFELKKILAILVCNVLIETRMKGFIRTP